MFEKCKKLLDNGENCGALLVDFSKAFDCIVHDPLLAKLSAYGFDYNSLKLMNGFLSGSKFRTKIGFSYTPYIEILVIVYSLFLYDGESNITNYADDTTLYTCEPNINLVLSKVEKDTSTIFHGFRTII